MKSACAIAILAVFLVMSLAACKSPAPTDSPLLISPLNSPISIPTPVPDVATRPSSSQITGPDFALDPPVLPGATKVTGQGPPGLAITIADMTMMGAPLGSGTIDPDGKFSISLDQPAIENHVIGIRVVADRPFTPEDIEQLMQRTGPGFKNYPRVGEAFDSVVVRGPE